MHDVFHDHSPWFRFNHGCPKRPPEDEPYNTPFAVLGYTESGEPVFTIHTVDGDTEEVNVKDKIIVLKDTTYEIEASEDETELILKGSDGSTSTVPLYSAEATTSSAGLMSAADKEKLDGIEEGAGKTGVFGIRGSAETTYTQEGNYDITKDKIGLSEVENKSSASIRGELTSDNVVTALGFTPANVSDIPDPSQFVTGVSGVKGEAETDYRTGDVNITKANLGLGNVENKSSANIRSELTSNDVITALGFTPANSSSPAATGRVTYVAHEIELVEANNQTVAGYPLSNLGVTNLYDVQSITVNFLPEYSYSLQEDKVTWGAYIDGSRIRYWIHNQGSADTVVHVVITVYNADIYHDSHTT